MPQPEWIPCPDQRKCAAQCRLARILIIINSGPMYLYYTPTQTQTHYYTLYNLNDRAPVRSSGGCGSGVGRGACGGRVRELRAACDGSTRGGAPHTVPRARRHVMGIRNATYHAPAPPGPRTRVLMIDVLWNVRVWSVFCDLCAQAWMEV